MRAARRSRGAALLGPTAALTALTALTAAAAYAAPNPGQAVVNDYGQSPAQVTAEVAAAVRATPAVINASHAVALAHARLLARLKIEIGAHIAYLLALRSRNTVRIAATRKVYLAAHALTLRPRAAEAVARSVLARLVATTTAATRAEHNLPVDGIGTGSVVRYFIPSIGLEPIQVRITVYGGHVSDISVPQFASTGDSAAYNARTLPILMQEAMSAKTPPWWQVSPAPP